MASEGVEAEVSNLMMVEPLLLVLQRFRVRFGGISLHL